MIPMIVLFIARYLVLRMSSTAEKEVEGAGVSLLAVVIDPSLQLALTVGIPGFGSVFLLLAEVIACSECDRFLTV